MLYIVSTADSENVVNLWDDAHFFAHHSDAREFAQNMADASVEPHFIYCLEHTDTVKPKPDAKKHWFKLEFSKVVTESLEIEIHTLEDAIELARLKYRPDEWELTKSYIKED